MKKKGTPVSGVKFDKDGRLVVIGPTPRDVSQARSWAKGGRKNASRVVTPSAARQFNTIKREK